MEIMRDDLSDARVGNFDSCTMQDTAPPEIGDYVWEDMSGLEEGVAWATGNAPTTRRNLK